MATHDIERRTSASDTTEPPPLWLESTSFAGLVFTTQIPDRPDGTVELGSVRAQAELTLGNLRRTLEEAGSGLDRLLHLTIYLTDMDDRMVFNEVYAQVLAPPYTVRCAVGVAALGVDGMKVEVTAIAARR